MKELVKGKKVNSTYSSQKEEHQWILNEENACPLCGTELLFDHKIDHLKKRVEETANCPCCHIRTKTKETTLN